MKYRCVWILQKFSLTGLVILLLYLTWSPENRKIFIEKSGVEGDISSITTQPVTVSMDLFKSRQQKLQTHCERANLTAIKPPRTIIYSRRLHLAYCPVNIAASTALKYAMATAEGKQIYSHRLYNISLRQAIHSDAQKLALRASPERVNGHVDVLLIVRDPWQRLISEYRRFYSIPTSSHSKDCQKSLGITEFITFDLFLKCVIKAVDTGAKPNVRILPIRQACSLCRIGYTRIVRFENILPELNTLFKANNARPQYEIFLKAFRSCPVKPSGKYDLLPYLKDVSGSSKDRIQQIYKGDFVLFGYTFLEELHG